MVNKHYLTMEQLQVGLYVHLDMKWFEHPFTFSHFKLKSEDQINTIRGLGLKTVRYSPELSDGTPPPQCATAAPAPTAVPELPPAMLAKRVMMEQMRERRQVAERIEKAYVNTAQVIRNIEKNLYSKPAESVAQASALIAQIADSILISPELAIYVMGDKLGGEELYLHSLNVTVLSMMMARDLKLPVEVVGALGIGALLHDIGLKEVPGKILLKTEPLTTPERNFYEMHCQYGVDIGQRLHLSAPVLAIIREHHERFDGSGYPDKLQGCASSLLSRIIVIANYYDELCNPPLIADALTPHEALSRMFSTLRGKFDDKLLQVFIRCLGVYPPGTIVQLSNGVIGMVATVNTARPMKPTLVLYDVDVPRDEAIMFDMERETEVSIAMALRPAQVSREVYNYLSPRKRISYYFDADNARPEGGKP